MDARKLQFGLVGILFSRINMVRLNTNYHLPLETDRTKQAQGATSLHTPPQQTSKAPATRITGIHLKFLCTKHIAQNQHTHTKRPRRTTSRLPPHQTGRHLLHLGTPTYHNPTHTTRRPLRRVPTTRPHRSPYRDASTTTNAARASTSLATTDKYRLQNPHPTLALQHWARRTPIHRRRIHGPLPTHTTVQPAHTTTLTRTTHTRATATRRGRRTMV